jgi:3-hydroxybutyryl-CoA dehydratase
MQNPAFAPSIAFEDLELGQRASLTTLVTAADIDAFARVSGDTNPVHLDQDFAERTSFKSRIAHGMLTAAYVSAVFGTRLPGPGAIYISQTLNFRGPVRIGDSVETTVTLVELYPAKCRVRFDCTCVVNGRPVLVGEAMLMVPSRSSEKM